jgi:hypothetical protein
MDWTSTFIILGLSAGLFVLSSWRAARPTEFGKVRMIPWTSLILVSGMIAIFMLVHLVNLAGIQTGRPQAR